MNASSLRRISFFRRTSLLSVALVSAFWLTGCEELLPQKSAGEKVWRKHCAECHGFNGVGKLAYQKYRTINLVDDYWEYGGDDSTIESVTLQGIFPAMPAFEGKIKPNEMRELLVFMRAMRGED